MPPEKRKFQPPDKYAERRSSEGLVREIFHNTPLLDDVTQQLIPIAVETLQRLHDVYASLGESGRAGRNQTHVLIAYYVNGQKQDEITLEDGKPTRSAHYVPSGLSRFRMGIEGNFRKDDIETEALDAVYESLREAILKLAPESNLAYAIRDKRAEKAIKEANEKATDAIYNSYSGTPFAANKTLVLALTRARIPLARLQGMTSEQVMQIQNIGAKKADQIAAYFLQMGENTRRTGPEATASK